jgi:hypothetical protein
MKKLLLMTFVSLAFGVLLLGADGIWTGVVSDSHCAAKHAKANDAAASCVTKCVADGAKYVLVSEGNVYSLKPQDKFAQFAGKSVKVTGTEDQGTISATSVEAAQ